MSYLGNAPRFGDYPVKTFTGNGSLTSFSLDHSVPSDASIIVFINGERKPVGSYTAAGTSTLDFGAGNAPANLASIEVVHLGLEATLNTPADLSVTTGKIVDDAVTADKLANSINTEIAANTAKTGITSGQASAITANTAKVTNATHTGDVTGSTALTIAADAVDIAMLSATGTASATTFLRGDNTWTAVDALPSQSGNAGKYLTTNATTASWATLDTDANTTTKGLYEHEHTIDANYSIANGSNALSAGPITIDTGNSVTVPTGSTWVIV